MKYKSLSFLLFVIIFTVFGKSAIAHAQISSDSASISSLSALPTFFPTATPTPSPINGFSLLQQLNDLSKPTGSIPSISSESATQIASHSAQDYCLNVPVIMYHHTEPLAIASQLGHAPLTEDNTYFEEHIKYLTEHNYHFLALSDLVYALYTRGTIPAKSVVITIDDGYIDNYTYAFMMAKKYHAIINFMIPTGYVGQPDYMTWDHLKEMVQNPYARLYNHTTSHAPLGLINQSQIIKEVSTANTDLKNNLGLDNKIVIYPYGNYSDLAIQTLQQIGMIAAVSTDPGTDECLSNIMKLHRVRVGNEPIEDYGY